MSFQRHRASESPKVKPNSCGNITRGLGRLNHPERINSEEISKACDRFLVARVPGYRVMSIGGR